MGDLWRSKPMTLVKVSFRCDDARDILEAIGELDLIELRDLRAGVSFYNRSFVDECKKCDYLGGILTKVGAEIAAANDTLPKSAKIVTPEYPPEDGAPGAIPMLETFEPAILSLDEELEGQKEQFKWLRGHHTKAKEALLVLELGKQIYSEADAQPTDTELLPLTDFESSRMSMSKGMGPVPDTGVQVVCGMVKTESLAALQRVIWRATRCNAVFNSIHVEELLLDVETLHKGGGEMVEKSFFMVFLVSKNAADKVRKIASHFGADLYPFPQNPTEYYEKLEEAKADLVEAEDVMAKQQAAITSMLRKVSSDVKMWGYVVAREATIYDALNKSDYDVKKSTTASIEGWVPTESLPLVEYELTQKQMAKGRTPAYIMPMPTRLTPPTYIPVTPFTSGFQGLVNTYGTPRYREVNPGAFCCIMFPYLFGIMFGDLGHGIMLAMFGYYLISKEKEWDKQKLSDMVAMIYGGRYIIFLNGIFGAFVGLLYNEAFAFPMCFFGGSHWAEEEEQFAMATPTPYVVGIDPIWHRSANKITFFNSLKMKISIIVGVLQMTVGIMLSLLNHLEYKDYKKVFFQWVPEIVFFEGIFGYLVLCIFYKWAYDWPAIGARAGEPPHVAPNLLNMLINMFMAPGSDIAEPLYGHECYTDCESAVGAVGLSGLGTCLNSVITEACPESCWNHVGEKPPAKDRLGPGMPEACFSPVQAKVQLYLLIAAFVAVPLLLLPIPFIEIHHHSKAKKGDHTKLLDADAAKSHEHVDEAEGHGGDHDDEEFSAGDAFIHQGIHTIEFVLGAISNTASYLRLWALSLAHSQLAELFKDMVFGTGLKGKDWGSATGEGVSIGDISPLHILMLFVTFGAWLIMSFVVLMVMENLSSFLHALRLQWVEFQSKFFYGDGYRFNPLSFKNIGDDDAAEE